jgi:hypothetical protein
MNIRWVGSILVVAVIVWVAKGRSSSKPADARADARAAAMAEFKAGNVPQPTVERDPSQDTPKALQSQAAHEVIQIAALEMDYYKAHDAFALSIQLLGFAATPGMAYYLTPDTTLNSGSPAPRIEIAVYNPVAGSTCKPQESGANYNSIRPGTTDVPVSCQQGERAYAQSDVLPPPGYERYFRR